VLTIVTLAEAASIAAALSTDAFTAGIAFGGGKIAIRLKSILIISIVCSAVLGLAMLAGKIAAPLLPGWVATAAAFAILFILGAMKLLDGLVRSIILKHSGIDKEIKFTAVNLKFLVKIYADPAAVDIDDSREISGMETAALAISLSIDGIAAGFGTALLDVNAVLVVIASLLFNMAALLLGRIVGAKAANLAPGLVSWVCGGILILMAVSKLI